MIDFRSGPKAAAVLCALSLIQACDTAEAPARGSQVERPSFQADRAFAHVGTQLDFGPRIPGEPGHAAQLDWMVERLAASGATVVLDRWDYETTGGVTLPLTNVLARYSPEAERRLLLLAHWDTRPESSEAVGEERLKPVPGANDGASGVAVLLELASMMSVQATTVGVDLLFLDGEDYGPTPDDVANGQTTANMFIGSKRFAANTPNEWAYGILLDMVGDTDPSFPIEGFSAQYAPQVAQRVWGIAADLGYGRYFPTRIGLPISDDHVPLNEAGIPTINIIDFVYGPDTKTGGQYWHTPQDTLDKVSAFTLGMVGEVVAEVIYRGG